MSIVKADTLQSSTGGDPKVKYAAGTSGDLLTEFALADALAKSIFSGAATWRRSWATATVYAVNDIVIQNSLAYLCKIAHTSGDFATDLAANRWSLFLGNLASNILLSSGDSVQDYVGNRVINVKDAPYSAAGDNVTDDLAAIQAAIDAVTESNGTLFFPDGTYRLSGQLLVDTSDGSFRMTGSSPYKATLNMPVATSNSLLKCQRNGGVNVLTNIVIDNLGFNGGDVSTGAAIELVDFSNAILENLYIQNFSQNTTTSRGVWTKGRESLRAKNIRMSDVMHGFYIDHNPNNVIDSDHFHFEDIHIVPSDKDNGTGWYIVADNIHNFTIDGANPIPAARYAFYWKTATSSSESSNIKINGIRAEQGDTTNKDCWLIYIDNSDTLRQLSIGDCRASSSNNGIYLRGTQNVSIDDTALVAGAGYTGLDIGPTVGPVKLENVFRQSGLTFNTSSHKELSIYDPTASLYPIQIFTINDVYLSQQNQERLAYKVSLADDAEVSLPAGRAGVVDVMIGDNQEWGRARFNSGGAVTLIANSTNVVNTDTDTNLCIYDSGSTVNIKNRLGSKLTVMVVVQMYTP